MVLRTVAAILLVVPVAMPVAAQKQPEQAQAEPSRKPKMVCRNEGVTGSRIAMNRICMTQAEWDKLEADTQNQLDRMSRESGVSVAESARTARNTPGPSGGL